MKRQRRETTDILLLTSNFPPVGGGIAHFVFELARHLPSSRVRVIATPARDGAALDRGLPFPVVRLRTPLALNAQSRLFKFMGPAYVAAALSQPRFRDVLCDQAHPTLLGAAAALRRLVGARTTVLAHGTDVGRRQFGAGSSVYRRMLFASDRVIANSEATRALVHRTGYPPERTFVVNPCIDPGGYPVVLPPDDLRAAMSLGDQRIILTVARLVPRKGIDTVLTALPLLLPRFPDVHYLVAGTGPDRPRLEALASELGVRTHVTFAGYVPQQHLPSYYALCEVFALVSHEIPAQGDIEGFGIVFLEAGLFGKPVVAGHSGGIPDAVVDGLTGLLVKPRDPNAAAAALASLLSDAVLRRSMGEAGRSRVLRHFTSRTAATRLLGILDEGGPGRPDQVATGGAGGDE